MKIIVIARAGAKEEKIEQVSDREFKVWVHKQPEKGEANAAIVKLLSKHFNIPKSSIILISSLKSKTKLFEIGLKA